MQHTNTVAKHVLGLNVWYIIHSVIYWTASSHSNASSCCIVARRIIPHCTASMYRIAVLHGYTTTSHRLVAWRVYRPSYCIVVPHRRTASHIVQYLCYISHHIIGPRCVSYVALHIALYIALHIIPCSIICNTQIRVYTYHIRFLCVTN